MTSLGSVDQRKSLGVSIKPGLKSSLLAIRWSPPWIAGRLYGGVRDIFSVMVISWTFSHKPITWSFQRMAMKPMFASRLKSSFR